MKIWLSRHDIPPERAASPAASDFGTPANKKPARMRAFHCKEAMLLQRGLGDLDELSESVGIGDGHVGENLAVELDAGLLEAVHEHGVRQAVDAGCSIDTGDPETTDVALLVATVAVLVLERVLDLLFSSTIGTRLRAIVAFCTAEDDTTLFMGGNCALNTRN